MAGFERVLGFEGEKRTPCFGLVQPQQVSLGANGPEYSNSRGGLWRLRRRFAIALRAGGIASPFPSGEAEIGVMLGSPAESSTSSADGATSGPSLSFA